MCADSAIPDRFSVVGLHDGDVFVSTDGDHALTPEQAAAFARRILDAAAVAHDPARQHAALTTDEAERLRHAIGVARGEGEIEEAEATALLSAVTRATRP